MQINTEKRGPTLPAGTERSLCLHTPRPFQRSKLRQQCIYSTVVMQRKTRRLQCGRPWIWPRGCCVPNNGQRRQGEAHWIFQVPTRIHKHAKLLFHSNFQCKINGLLFLYLILYLPCHYSYQSDRLYTVIYQEWYVMGRKPQQKQAERHCYDVLTRVKAGALEEESELTDFLWRWSLRL